MKTLDELDALHAAAFPGVWCTGTRGECATVYVTSVPPMRAVVTFAEVSNDDNAHAMAALHNAWPEVSARLRAAEAALRGMLRAHPNCHEEGCGGYGCDDDYLTDDPDGDTGGDIHVCVCGAIAARNAARAALREP